MHKRGANAGLVTCWLLGFTACAGGPAGPGNGADIRAWMEFHQVPGVSVAVIKDFRLAYVEAHGVTSKVTREPVTERTLFQAASLSKAVSSAGVMTLVQDGTVSLDRDVNDYLTSWRVPYNALQATEKVTLRRLLSMTAGTTVRGFRGYRYTESVPTLLQILNGQPPANSAPIVVDRVPGTEFRYSGGGYLVAQQAVMDVTGTAFPQFMRERVLAPAGMEHSSYQQPLPDSLVGMAASGYYADGTAVPGGHHIYPEIAAGGLWTTPTDLAGFLIELQRALRGESQRVLRQESVAELLRPLRSDYALGLALAFRGRQLYFHHEGANDGFRCAMLFHATSGDGAIVMTNSDHGLELSEAIFRVIGKRERWPGA